MREDKLTDVPSDKVGEVVGDFVQDGAKEIEAVRKNGGLWDITARFDGN